MNNPAFEQMSSLYKAFAKPMQEMTTLNVQSMQKAYDHFQSDALLNAKTPDDLIELQKKLATETSQQASEYWQASMEIWQNATGDMMQNFEKNVAPAKKPKTKS